MDRRQLLKAGITAGSWAALGKSAGAQSQTATSTKRFDASWTSIDARPIPPWFLDAKFGIFIHWGVYSVPAYAPVHAKDESAYAEWYWHSLDAAQKKNATTGDGAHTLAFHNRVYGPNFKYPDFAPMFRAEMFDPDHWASVFEQSGAKYVALTSKHHEGFTLWKNEQANRAYGRPWNSVDVGPKRDLLLELTEAGRRKGLEMGIYYSLYEWFNPLWLTAKPRFVSEHLFPQFKDLVNHAKPSIIFTDGEWEIDSASWHSTELLQWLLNESPVADHVVVNDRWGKETRHKHGGYYTTEYTPGMQQSSHPWEESRGMGFSYGYNRNETLTDYHTHRELTLMLVDIVSRGGNLLLDIGPRADGQIPVIMEERLMQIGQWLKANGDAIYGTRPYQHTRQWSEGKVPKLEDSEFMAAYEITDLVDKPPAGYAHVEAFFTGKGTDTVYALLPRWPADGKFLLREVPVGGSATMTLLETGDAISWKPQGNSAELSMPSDLRMKLPERTLYTIKISGVKA